jgi:hypothetical protein
MTPVETAVFAVLDRKYAVNIEVEFIDEGILPLFILRYHGQETKYTIRQKSKPSFYGKTGKYEFGIDLRDLDYYKRYKVDAVIFVRLDTREMYVITLKDLIFAARLYMTWDLHAGMWYVPLDAMQKFDEPLQECVA